MSAAAGPPALHRDTQRGLVAGVLAGLGGRMGIDPVLLRVVFVIAVIATGGLALLLYLVAWAALPAVDGEPPPLARVGRLAQLRRLPRVRGDWRIAAGFGLLTLSVLLAFRQLGIWWSDALVWPLVLAAFGATLLWGRSREARPDVERRPGEGGWRAPARPGAHVPAAESSSRLVDLYGGVFGVLLVVGAALLFLSSNHVLGGLRDAALTSVVVIVALGLILAPFLWRLGRKLAAERAERIRSEERTELAAHLHDSVLQTLTLMQKRADDPREVAALARRQERELREWLAADGRRSNAGTFSAALRASAESTEDDHRVAVEVVTVGDCELEERAQAVLAAAREALVNAAKHAGEAGPVRLYAEIDDEQIEVFVTDRGPGFDLADVPQDRQGVRESILGRMKRAGGRAQLRSAPGRGTEVELAIERAHPVPERAQE
jgi:phage shock protein PspC (stress-responsive transcriptional regulator)/two-component sensor histidine kinase